MLDSKMIAVYRKEWTRVKRIEATAQAWQKEAQEIMEHETLGHFFSFVQSIANTDLGGE